MKTRILLVEDDERLADLTAEYLRKNDFEVAIEVRGDTAEARILKEDPELVILAVMLQVVHRFRENEGALPVDELRRRLSLPTRIVNDVLHQLVRTGLLIEIRNPDDDREVAFAPGRDIHEMTLYNIFRTIDNYSSTRLYFAATEETRRIDRALDELQTACRTAGDRLRLIDLDDAVNAARKPASGPQPESKHSER